MNSDKLFIEVMQNMQGLIRLFEKAIAVEGKLYVDFKTLAKEGVSTEMRAALELQIEKVHNTFTRLEETMYE